MKSDDRPLPPAPAPRKRAVPYIVIVYDETANLWDVLHIATKWELRKWARENQVVAPANNKSAGRDSLGRRVVAVRGSIVEWPPDWTERITLEEDEED